MDLLAGYGSEGDSDGDGSPAPSAAAAPPPKAAARPAPAPVSGNRSLLSKLPAPQAARGGGGGGAFLFSSLPPPRADVRGASAPSGTGGKTVQWRPPISAAALSAANDEEERPKKVSKSTKGSSLMSMLPKPKNVLGAGSGGGTEALLGGGSAGPRSLGGSQSHHSSPASRPAAAAAASEPSTGYGGNDVYRLDASGAYGAHAYAAASTAAPPPQHHYSAAPAAPQHRGAPSAGPSRHYDYNPQEHVVATAYEGTLETLQESTAPVRQAVTSSDEAGNGLSLLQAELERERDRQVKLGRKPGKAPKIVNINQEKLKYVAPTVNAAQTAAETAFGPQYKAQLRKEAGDKGSKTARRKHQIGTLYHEMKLAELDMLESRSTGQKSKAETAAKYGW